LPDGIGNACVAYSVNSGVNWTSIRCDTTSDGWGQITDSVTLSPTQMLSKVQVGVCAQGSNASSIIGKGQDNVQVFDIWTLGATTAQSGGSGSGVGQAHRGIVIVN
jgi:hypothetical protein